MKKISQFFEIIAMLIVLPFVLLFRLLVILIVVGLPILLVMSPFLLIGFIVWVIAQ